MATRSEQWMRNILAKRWEEGTFRELRTNEQDQCFVDFTSNDYLGMGRAADLREAIVVEAAEARKEISQRRKRQRHYVHAHSESSSSSAGFPVVGSGGSRLLSGNTVYAEELERWIARFHRRDSALLFNSGYDANLGLMSCLPQPGDSVVCDELVHNSVVMGCRLGRQKETLSFRHNDVDSLDEALRSVRGGKGNVRGNGKGSGRGEAAVSSSSNSDSKGKNNIFVAVESVYSMDGDLAPLGEILRVADAHGALVIVDEAHATGVFGESGRGLVSALGLEGHPSLLAGMHSFGKAFGAHGAVVVGSATLKEFLVNYARPLIYSTSLSLDSLACIKCAYLMQAGADDRRRRVLELADTFQSLLTEEERSVRDGDGGGATPPLEAKDVPRNRSPIQCVLLSGNDRSSFVAASLRSCGFDVRAIRKPTVAEGTERLRITLHAYNTDAEVESLARHIRRLAAETKGNEMEGTTRSIRDMSPQHGQLGKFGDGMARGFATMVEPGTRARL